MKMSLSAVIYLWSMYPMLLAFQGERKIFSPLGGMNKRLVHSSMVSIETVSLDRCLDSCMYRTDCLSINFLLATNQCELLKVNVTSYAEGMEESKPGYLHVDLSEWLEIRSDDPCSTRPCGISQRCIGTKRAFVTCPDIEKYCEEVFLVSGPHGVPDNQLTASSAERSNDQPHMARLDSTSKWDPSAEENPFIQVAFNKLEMVRGVVTKGSGNSNYWVTKYKIAISKDCVDFQFLWHPLATEIFDGNTDSNTAVTNYFDENIQARCLRVYPLESNRWVVMRFDVIGCLWSDRLSL